MNFLIDRLYFFLEKWDYSKADFYFFVVLDF